jgi:hypothetical protein
MAERSEGLADRTQHHLQEIQGTSPHIWVDNSIGRRSLVIFHFDSHYYRRSQKITTPYSGYLCLFLLVPSREFVFPVMTSVPIEI